MSFDQHCASCHAPEGTLNESDPILGELLVPPAQLPGEWKRATAVEVQARGRKQVASKIRHRDSWIIFNALRIRQSIDRDGEAAERLTLRSRIAYLQQLAAVRPVHEATPEELQAAATELQREIAEIDAKLALSGASDPDAIRETLEAAQTVAKLVAATSDDAKTDALAIVAATLDTAPKPLPPDAEAQVRFDRRKTELLKLLDSITTRAADDSVGVERGPRGDRVEQLQELGLAAVESDLCLDVGRERLRRRVQRRRHMRQRAVVLASSLVAAARAWRPSAPLQAFSRIAVKECNTPDRASLASILAISRCSSVAAACSSSGVASCTGRTAASCCR